jgi:hypothetical protein
MQPEQRREIWRRGINEQQTAQQSIRGDCRQRGLKESQSTAGGSGYGPPSSRHQLRVQLLTLRRPPEASSRF